MVSTQPAPPSSQDQDQEHAPVSSLPLEADPSGFTERAPALLSLLPDEVLRLALARGEGLAVHAALTARLDREPSGAVRDTLRELLGNRALFVMAERPPRLGHFLGTGVALVGLPAPEQQQTPFIATRAVSVLGVPLWPLGEHLIQRARDGRLEVLGRVAAASGSSRRWRRRILGLAAAGLAATGLGLAPFVVREVQLANGLSRPVEVRLDDRTVTLQPGELVQEEVYSLGSPYHVEARWPGAQEPFEALSLESSQHAVYNVLDAASLRLEDPARKGLTIPLEGRTASVESGGHLQWQGGWESKFREYAQAGRTSDAANLARAVFLADPSEQQAAEDAARMLAQSQPREALGFAADLQRRFPEDPALNRLAQELFLALGKREEAYAQYKAWAQKAPDSAQRALWAAQVAPLNEQRAYYTFLKERFPDAPEVKRAVARLRYADGFPKEALELLDAALAKSPETFEDLELRVRVMMTLQQWREASGAINKFAGDPKHASWELAVLGGRVAQIVGPTRTQYVTRELIPPAFTSSPERMAAFALLTGERAVTDKDLKAIADPTAREAIELTRSIFQDWDKAVGLASEASDLVLSRLDSETAALLGLELSRRGQAEAADRVFGSSLSLMAARGSLEAYVREGQAKRDFPLLPPGLQAAAYLVRASAMKEGGATELGYARSADSLDGMARRALDASYQIPEPVRVTPSKYWPHLHAHHIDIIQIIGRDTPEALRPEPPKPPEERAPRPWPAP